MLKPTLGWIVSTALCMAVVFAVAVVFDAPWQFAAVLAAGGFIGCVVSLMLYRRRNTT